MATVNNEAMGLSADNINDMDGWILDFLSEHEWATPNLMRQIYMDEEDHEVTRQWVSSRLRRLSEHDHLEQVHPDAAEYRLVDDPR